MRHLAASVRERAQSDILTVCVPLVIAILVNAALVVRLGIDWHSLGAGASAAVLSKEAEVRSTDSQLKALKESAGQLRTTRAEIDQFYSQRIPAHYSAIAIRLGDVEKSSGVKLSRLQFAQGKPGSQLTEILIDAGISGEYSQIARFVNEIERDQTYFVIRAMTLSGQDGGIVNLRLLVSTWLKPADAAASRIPQSAEPAKGSSGEPLRSEKGL